MKKLIIPLVAAAVGLVGIGIWLSRPAKASLQPQRGLVDRGAIVEKVSATGRLVPKTVEVVSTDVLVGRVIEISKEAEIGKEVKKDDVLLKLDEDLARARYEEADGAVIAAESQKLLAESKKETAQAQVELAKIKNELARIERERAEKNKANLGQLDLEKVHKAVEDSEQGIKIAIAQVKEADSAIQLAESAIKRAKAGLAGAEKALKQMIIKALASGIIIDKKVNSGQLISAQATPVLFAIAPDLSQMQVVAQVGESDIGRIEEGMQVRFTVDAYATEGEFDGRVKSIPYVPVNPVRGGQAAEVAGFLSGSGPVSYAVIIDVIPRKDGKLKLPTFRVGLSANVDFIVQEVSQTLRIPNAALNYRPDNLSAEELQQVEQGIAQGRRPVWIWNNGKPKLVLVQTGANDGSRTAIVEGELEDGTEVITEGPPPEKGSILEQRLPVKL